MKTKRTFLTLLILFFLNLIFLFSLKLSSFAAAPDTNQVSYDLNHDGRVDIFDLFNFLFNFLGGKKDSDDINHDGKANSDDFWVILNHWGIVSGVIPQEEKTAETGGKRGSFPIPSASPVPTFSPVPTSTPTPTPRPTPSPTIAAAPPPATSGFSRPFNNTSIWNKPISNLGIDTNSAAMINKLTAGDAKTIAGSDETWGVAVVSVDGNTPKRRVCGVDDTGGGTYYCEDNVPIPDNIHTPPDTDGKLSIIDTVTNHVWNFYQLKRSSRGSEYYTVGGYGAFGWVNQNGDGVTSYSGGKWGGRASGMPYYGGLIYPEEIKQGHIDHALAISLNCEAVSPTQVIWPARQGDGCGQGGNLIPYGARIQLDPSFDVNSSTLSNGGKIIARALQQYGGWVGETGGSTFAVYAREFLTANGQLDRSPWSGLLTSRDIDQLPLGRLRILQPANKSDFYTE